MFLLKALLAVSALVGCATTAQEQHPAHALGPLLYMEQAACVAHGKAPLAPRPGLLYSMQARALGCLD